MTRTERIDTTYSAGRVYGYEEGSRRYSEADGGVSYSITTTTARVETTYGSYGLVSGYVQASWDDTTGVDLEVRTTTTRTGTTYDDKGRALTYMDVSVKDDDLGLLSETTTVHRAETTYDVGLEGTGRELGFVQYTESTTSADLVTKTVRADITYSAARVDTYTEMTERYSNVEGTYFKEGSDGDAYSITTTTARVETTYGDYGLVSGYVQASWDDTTGADLEVVTTTTRTGTTYDDKGRALTYTDVSVKDDLQDLLSET